MVVMLKASYQDINWTPLLRPVLGNELRGMDTLSNGNDLVCKVHAVRQSPYRHIVNRPSVSLGFKFHFIVVLL